MENLFSVVPRQSKSAAILFIRIVIGAYLRLRGLEVQSLWGDEQGTMMETDPSNSVDQMLKYLRRGMNPHPPLHS